MASNVEIKARAGDFRRLQAVAERLSGTPGEVIEQDATFFRVPAGRLKLRTFSPDAGELIFYERTDQQGPKQCRYFISKTSQPATLKELLATALGIRGAVRKRRRLYLVGQTRIHLDEVEGLGQFVELEVVLRPEQNAAEGKSIARDLMGKLGIREEDLIEGAYIDLLEAGARA